MSVPNCYEYVCSLTSKGSHVSLSKDIVNEFVQHNGDGAGGYTHVTLYQQETPEQHKEKEKFLEEITVCALCCDDPQMFFDHVAMILYKKCKKEEYVEERWSQLLTHLWISCSMVLTKMVIQERFHKSAKILLDILQSRIKEWRKKAEGNIKKELDNDGNPTGGFVFNVVGELL